MKFDKMGLFGMFGMVLTFGVVIPQNINAADTAGIQRLSYLYNNNVKQGKELSNEEVDEIEKIICKDGKVDRTEYYYIYNILDVNDYLDNQTLPDDRFYIIQALHDDYAYYSDEVKEKYPELIDLDSKLPLDLREQINDLVLSNLVVKEHLSKDEKLNESYKKVATSELAYVKKLLQELQAILATSPYKTELTKIYDAETKLLNENLKYLERRLSEK